MSTFRVAKRARFTNIDRRTVNDDAVSFKALGLLVWMLDKPDDWSFDSETIARLERKEGRDAIRSAFRELEAAGYMRRERRQNERGHWVTETVVYEVPPTDDGFSGVGRPGVGQTDVGPADVGEPGALMKTVEPKTVTERESPSPMATDAARLCDLLADSLANRTDDARRPTVTVRWVTDMDRLLRIDERSVADVERVIRWLDGGKDEVAAFWRPNVRSPEKLRLHWDVMREQYTARKTRTQQGGGMTDLLNAAGSVLATMSPVSDTRSA